MSIDTTTDVMTIGVTTTDVTTVDVTTVDVLGLRRRAASPRFDPPSTPWASHAIHGGVAVLWVVLFARAFGGGGLLAWSAGLAYVAYDTVLIGFVLWQTRALGRGVAGRGTAGQASRAGGAGVAGESLAACVIVASRNEAGVLPATLAALMAQDGPPARIVVADDGSTDGTAALMARGYGMAVPALGRASESATHPGLAWLRLPAGGKAVALNAALLLAGQDPMLDQGLVLTVDADTLLDRGALSAMRRAFAADPGLVAATGVLSPWCGAGVVARVLQGFQRCEYVRNFLSRAAWTRADGLLLISGAFACYRRDPVLAVGGFDPDCLVEDYELTHRLRDHAVRTGQACRTAVVGDALARTEAPGTPGAFLRQRRRWFGGFLQTQFWYRHMVGSRRHGRLGLMMLPVKAVDTLQPVYGLLGVGLLLVWAASGRAVAVPIAEVVAAKVAVDLSFNLWSLRVYRRWSGDRGPGVGLVVAAALVEPFTFQILRHLGAALGWASLLGRQARWAAPARAGLRTS